MNKKIVFLLTGLALLSATTRSLCTSAVARDHKGIVSNIISAERFTLIENNKPTTILVSSSDKKGIRIAAENLQNDFARV